MRQAPGKVEERPDTVDHALYSILRLCDRVGDSCLDIVPDRGRCALDAVKEGSVPNVNDFTFGVYKTLANMGVDFRTIVSFMLQPGITKLVEKYKAGNSLYYDMYCPYGYPGCIHDPGYIFQEFQKQEHVLHVLLSLEVTPRFELLSSSVIPC